jgi:exodeoxyribonuclease VII large subunit
VPDLGELHERLDRARSGLERGARRSLDLKVGRLDQARDRLRRAPALLVERRRAGLEQAAGRLRALSPRATLNRGYAIVRADETIVRSAAAVESGEPIEVEVGDGRFGARVD